jgi:hypothetical protein
MRKKRSASFYDELHNGIMPRMARFQIDNIQVTLTLGDILIISLTCILTNWVKMGVLHIEHPLGMVTIPSVKGVSRYLKLLLLSGDAPSTGPNRVGIKPNDGGSFQNFLLL